MGRPGRVGVLLVAVLALAAVGNATVPPHLDDDTERDSDRCSFFYLANEVGPVGEADHGTVTPYADLDPDRRALFERWLESESRTIPIAAGEWRALYNGTRPSHYIAYEGRLYRNSVSFNRCELWEAIVASE